MSDPSLKRRTSSSDALTVSRLNWDRVRGERLVVERGGDPIGDDATQSARGLPSKREGQEAEWRRRTARWAKQDLKELKARVRAMAPAERAARRNSLRNQVRRLTASAAAFERVWAADFEPLIGRTTPRSARRRGARTKGVEAPAPRAVDVATRREIRAAAVSLVVAHPDVLTQRAVARVLGGVTPTSATDGLRQTHWWARYSNVPVAGLRAEVGRAIRAGVLERNDDGVLRRGGSKP